jgi:hypothetical protein
LVVVLGADIFFTRYRPLYPSIAVDRLPWLMERIGIFYRECYFERLVVDQLPALHDVQVFGVRRAVLIYIGLVAFIMADRLAVPDGFGFAECRTLR